MQLELLAHTHIVYFRSNAVCVHIHKRIRPLLLNAHTTMCVCFGHLHEQTKNDDDDVAVHTLPVFVRVCVKR